MLHRFVQKVKSIQTDRNVTRPSPSSFFYLLIEQGHGIGACGGALDREHEHAGEHLIENDADGPHIDLVTVA
jgi:hypothetical protein